MAHSLSARKRVRQNETRRAANRWRLRTLRESVKELNDKILHASPADAETALRKAFAVIDRSAVRGVIHKNTAARKKSRLSAKVKAMKTARKA